MSAYDEIPRIRIELEGIRQTVCHLFDQNNNELTRMIVKRLETVFTEEWVQEQIDQEVVDCTRKAIRSLSDDYQLQRIITQTIIDSLKAILETRNVK